MPNNGENKFGDFRPERELTDYEVSNFDKFMLEGSFDSSTSVISLTSTVEEFFAELKSDVNIKVHKNNA